MQAYRHVYRQTITDVWIAIFHQPTLCSGARLVTVVGVCHQLPFVVCNAAGGRAGRPLGAWMVGVPGACEVWRLTLHGRPVRLHPIRARLVLKHVVSLLAFYPFPELLNVLVSGSQHWGSSSWMKERWRQWLMWFFFSVLTVGWVIGKAFGP